MQFGVKKRSELSFLVNDKNDYFHSRVLHSISDILRYSKIQFVVGDLNIELKLKKKVLIKKMW